MTIRSLAQVTMVVLHEEVCVDKNSPPISVTLLYYDQPQYDVFWKTVVELDVPVYFHPRTNIPLISSLVYSHAPWLKGAGQEFAVTLSTHILGLCTNGVFE